MLGIKVYTISGVSVATLAHSGIGGGYIGMGRNNSEAVAKVLAIAARDNLKA